MTPISMFFGDGDHSFALNQPQIIEFENKCGAIAAICGRVFARQFSQSEIAELVRLSLIGSGEVTPKRAAELVALYVTDRPLNEFYPIALSLCEAVWFGEPHEGNLK